MKHFLTLNYKSEDILVSEKFYYKDYDFFTPRLLARLLSISSLKPGALLKEIRCFYIYDDSSWIEILPSLL